MITEIMKHQMEQMGMSSYYLWKYTGVGYATVNGLLNGDRKIESMRYGNYANIMNALFTNTEKYILSFTAMEGLNQYQKVWKATLKHALNQTDVKIYRSGAPDYDEDGNPRKRPIHVQVQWGAVEMKHHTPYLNELNIFDGDLYRSMNNKGQRDKRELVREYLKE